MAVDRRNARLGALGLVAISNLQLAFQRGDSGPVAVASSQFAAVAVVLAVLLTAVIRKPEWSLLPDAAKGSVFLLSLVTCASMMPVEELPQASALTALALGFVSAVFDNIPLTALALKQGGYDWGYLAYAVGFLALPLLDVDRDPLRALLWCVLGTPLLVRLLEWAMFPGVPVENLYLHPVARGAWVVVLATALNLLPIGQLDGGHIL